MNIFVGNMAREVRKESLKEEFDKFGKVDAVTILIDRINGEWKAFGFIEMPNDLEARLAITEMDGCEFMKQKLIVHEARYREGDRRISGRRGGRRFTDYSE